MKMLRGVLLISVMGACFFLCRAPDVFGLYRDDISIEEAEKLISSERERSRIELKKRQVETEEEILKFEGVTTAEEKQVAPSVSLAKKAPSSLNKKIVIAVVCLVIVIAIVFGNKLLSTNKPQND
ncbi:MAG: hypothetical protein KKH11_01780 [Candidatus Omnitrophica bacterium]|nr:hypothetical protein [Candidatus Omnitrophota bacterium]